MIVVPFARAQLFSTSDFLCSPSMLFCRLRGRASRSSSRSAWQVAVSEGPDVSLLQAKQPTIQPTGALSLAPPATPSSGSSTFQKLSR